jgi:hypothetical protein
VNQLPRGIWFERAKNRYRVRRYRNHVTYLAGYFSTEEEARAALTELDAFLDSIPRERRSSESQSVVHVPVGNFAGVTQSLREEQRINPYSGRVKQYE